MKKHFGSALVALAIIALVGSGLAVGFAAGEHVTKEKRDAQWGQLLDDERQRRAEIIDAHEQELADSFHDAFKSGESMGVSLEQARVAGCASKQHGDSSWCSKPFYKFYVKKGVH